MVRALSSITRFSKACDSAEGHPIGGPAGYGMQLYGCRLKLLHEG